MASLIRLITTMRSSNDTMDILQDREALKLSPENSVLSMCTGRPSRIRAKLAGGLRETINIPYELTAPTGAMMTMSHGLRRSIIRSSLRRV